jgi:hypothetical protein
MPLWWEHTPAQYAYRTTVHLRLLSTVHSCHTGVSTWGFLWNLKLDWYYVSYLHTSKLLKKMAPLWPRVSPSLPLSETPVLWSTKGSHLWSIGMRRWHTPPPGVLASVSLGRASPSVTSVVLSGRQVSTLCKKQEPCWGSPIISHVSCTRFLLIEPGIYWTHSESCEMWSESSVSWEDAFFLWKALQGSLCLISSA